MFPRHKLYSKYEKICQISFFFQLSLLEPILVMKTLCILYNMWNNVFAEGRLSESLIYSEVKAIRKWWNRYIEHKKFTVPSILRTGKWIFLALLECFWTNSVLDLNLVSKFIDGSTIYISTLSATINMFVFLDNWQKTPFLFKKWIIRKQ